MDFNFLYDKIHHLKFSCNITNLFTIKKIMFGSGGSNNIIISVRDKDNDRLIIKIIPNLVYINVKKKPNNDQLEIKFYQFFTQKYILTDRTPHIVGVYNYQHCSKIDKLLTNIRSSKKICPTYEDRLTKKNKLC